MSSGTLPEPRKRHLPLSRPLSLDAFCAQMAPHNFRNPDNLLHIFPYPDKPSADFTRSEEPSSGHSCPFMFTHRAREPRSHEAAPFPNPNGLDNTVGPVPKISGYVFNTLQTNSDAHVPNTNMNPINEDTHFCDLDLYETIFQNWCIIDEINSMTPDTSNFSVTPPNVNMSSEAFKDCRDNQKTYNLTGRDLREFPAVEI